MFGFCSLSVLRSIPRFSSRVSLGIFGHLSGRHRISIGPLRSRHFSVHRAIVDNNNSVSKGIAATGYDFRKRHWWEQIHMNCSSVRWWGGSFRGQSSAKFKHNPTYLNPKANAPSRAMARDRFERIVQRPERAGSGHRCSHTPASRAWSRAYIRCSRHPISALREVKTNAPAARSLATSPPGINKVS